MLLFVFGDLYRMGINVDKRRNMKEKLGQFKEFAGKLSSKTKRVIAAVATVLVVETLICNISYNL